MSDLLDEMLFEVTNELWRFRSCPVCGGAMSVAKSHTYAMQRQGWVKIGSSSNPAERRSVLAMPSPGCRVRAPEQMNWAEPILLLGVIEGDHEHELHRRFASLHVIGEWFLPDAEMCDWLVTGLISLADAGLPTKRVSKRPCPQ